MAVLRHPPSRRDRLPCARARACHGEAPLVLHDSRERRAAKTGAPDRSSGARLAARRKDDLCGSRRAGKESEKTCRAREESGDAIFAEESDPVHIACGRGDSRADPRPRLQGLKLGGPGTAVRGHVDARAACFASNGRPRDRSHHAVGVCRGGAPRTRGAGVHGIRPAAMDHGTISRRRSDGRFAAHRRGRAACG